MSERVSCTYCGADAERGHSCEKSPNVDEALRRINEGSLVYYDLSDPMDYDISLVAAEITALRARLSSAEAERDYAGAVNVSPLYLDLDQGVLA